MACELGRLCMYLLERGFAFTLEPAHAIEATEATEATRLPAITPGPSYLGWPRVGARQSRLGS